MIKPKGSRPLHRYLLLRCDFLLSDNPESIEPVVQQQERKNKHELCDGDSKSNDEIEYHGISPGDIVTADPMVRRQHVHT